MQKSLNNWKICAILAPCLVFLVAWRSFAWVLVASFSPKNAIKYVMETGFVSETGVQNNPFKDFKLPQTETENIKESDELNPNYNVVQEFFESYENSLIFKKDNCYIKNVTYLSDDEVSGVALSPVGFKIEKNSTDPQILIYHTHATESYLPDAEQAFDAGYSFRSTDTDKNMVAVGRVLTDRLNRLGYCTVQDTTLHDYPSYNGSYDKSKDTIQKYLDRYPSIKVVLDIHRDAAERDGAIISPVAEIDGEKCAQIMIISGADNGKMNMPNYFENLKFSSAVQNTAATMYPGLMRPLLFDYRNYNQQMSTGAFLVEIGTHGATLNQAKRAAYLFANALAKTFDGI